MQRVTGPECPDCGCCDGTSLGSHVRVIYARSGGAPIPVDEETVLRIECQHCGKRFSAIAHETNGQHPDAEVIPFPTLRCPTCGSKDNYVTSTRTAGLRYHRCRACGCNFKSREQ